MTDAAVGQASVGICNQVPADVNKFSSVELPGQTASTPVKPNSSDADPPPKWRAMFFISINGQRRPVLGDSGCTGSCVSLDYYRKNPSLKDSFVPKKSCGTAINGSDVKAIGEVKLDFSLEETPMTITCKVIKGLMDPIVLGWDWMFKYSVAMDPAKGYVHYGDGMSRTGPPSHGVLLPRRRR